MYQEIKLAAQQTARDWELRHEINSRAIYYMRGKDQFQNLPLSVKAELHDYVRREFNALSMPVIFVNREVNCEEMERLFAEQSILYISALNNNSDLFPRELNLQFRAIHDKIHLLNNFPCDYEGELNTYKEQSKGLSHTAAKVLYSEIVLQACYYISTGDFMKNQKIVFYPSN